MICDWWISIRFVCFCVLKFVALFLKSTVSFTLAFVFVFCFFFVVFILKHGKFRFPGWNCSYRASKSRGNPDTEEWKRTGTFLLTFAVADKHSGCYGNGLIDVTEKFEFGACSIWIVEDVGWGSFLFPIYLGRSKETLFAGYGNRVAAKIDGLTRVWMISWVTELGKIVLSNERFRVAKWLVTGTWAHWCCFLFFSLFRVNATFAIG